MCRRFDSGSIYLKQKEGAKLKVTEEKTMDDKEKNLIKEYFKRNGLPKPVTIKHIGRWAHGERYAVTCGLVRMKKYCVYFGDDGGINSVRKR